MTRLRTALQAGTLVCIVAVCVGAGTASAQQSQIQRGRYIIQVGACNDCHTPGYPESGGNVDEKLWLTGSPLGWRGPWGTTYPPNLRLAVQKVSEGQWLKHARQEWRPPMPWFNLRDMSDSDLMAVYRYIKSLGPAGEPAPAYVAPDQEPNQPFVQFPPPPK